MNITVGYKFVYRGMLGTVTDIFPNINTAWVEWSAHDYITDYMTKLEKRIVTFEFIEACDALELSSTVH